MITKRAVHFTIDKKLMLEYDKLVPLNEKSLRVEMMIREFIEKNQEGVSSISWGGGRSHTTGKRGKRTVCSCKENPCTEHYQSERVMEWEKVLNENGDIEQWRNGKYVLIKTALQVKNESS